MVASSKTPIARAAIALALFACGGTSATDGANDGGGTALSDGGGATAADGGGAPGRDDEGGATPDATSPVSGDAASGSSATLRFIGAAYTLYARIGDGAPHVIQLDTGSLGLYVPKTALGASAQISATETCSITYVSSGNTLSGHAATATVALLGSTSQGDVAEPPKTDPMPLCAVDDATFKGGVMGVGFGRGAGSDPARNVLLRMSAIAAGTMHPGFVLSTHPSPSVQIGLTGSSGFQVFALTRQPSGSDFLASSLRGCLSLPQFPAFGPACGPLLVDTGVADCLVWGPSDPSLGGAVAAGQTTVSAGASVRVAIPDSASTLAYAFVVGAGADSPAAVSVRAASAFSINTGRALLNDYDYLFDAAAGQVGFRRAVP